MRSPAGAALTDPGPRADAAELRPGAARAGVVDGLDAILLIGACVAFAAALATPPLIRERGFVASVEEGELPEPAA